MAVGQDGSSVNDLDCEH
jgi:hypothetical protein